MDVNLLGAVRAGDLHAVKCMIQKYNCNPNCTDHRGNTPLHIACENRHYNVADFLIHKGTCINVCRREDKATPLHIACDLGDLDMVKLLVTSQKCDVNVADANGDTPLHFAATKSNLELCRTLLSNEHCDPNKQKQSTGETPLHIAICRLRFYSVTLHGSDLHIDVCDVLARDRRCRPSICNNLGDTPLHIIVTATYFKSPVIDWSTKACTLFNLLISKCDVNIQNGVGDTPLHIACYLQAYGVLRFLLACKQKPHTTLRNHKGETPQTIRLNQSGDTLIHAACQWGDTAIVRYLVQQEHADVTHPNSFGDTPLHIAMKHNCLPELIKILDPNTKDHCGSTVLHIAVEQKNLNLCKVILNNEKCDLNARDEDGNTPLHLAARPGLTNIAKLLLTDKRCSLNLQNRGGDTALHLAVAHNSVNVPICELLVATKGCDPNIKNHASVTPLHLAASMGNLKGCRAILKNQHCKVNIKDKDNNTPLHIAIEKNRKGIVECLVKLCDLNQTSKKGSTPLHVAVYVQNIEIVRILMAEKKCKLNMQDNFGLTPLHIAAYLGEFGIVQLLTRTKECNPNLQDHHGNTPLHVAVSRGDVKMSECMLAIPTCHPSLQNKKGYTPLHLTVMLDQESAVQCLSLKNDTGTCNDGCNVCNVQTALKTLTRIPRQLHVQLVWILTPYVRCNPSIVDNYGNTPLHIAARKGHMDVCSHIISTTKCDLNLQNTEGDTVLHIAVRKGHMDLSRCIISTTKCDLNLQNTEGDTVLHIAVRKGHMDVCSLIISTTKCDLELHNTEADTVLHIAVRQENHPLVKSLVKSCKPNIQGYSKKTPLHIAAEKGNLDICRLLLGATQCDLNLQCEGGFTPLHIAAYHSKIEVVDAIITSPSVQSAAINPNIKDDDGNTPLHIAARAPSGHNLCKAMCLAMLKLDQCDPNMQNCKGNTPLHIATRHNHIDAVVILSRDKRCNPNIPIPTLGGNTPLHIAVKRGSRELLLPLLSNELCDPNIRNVINHSTPLHDAIKTFQTPLAFDLLQHERCDPSIRDRHGNTPLHLACLFPGEADLIKVAKKLLRHPLVDPSCANNVGKTPLNYTTDYELIREISFITQSKTKHAIQNYIKLYVIGNPSTGKSTLVEAICQQASDSVLWSLIPSPLRRVRNVPSQTAGIIPTTLRHKKFGNTILYDMAGQYEYYSSHAAVIESTEQSSPPAFFVIIDLSEDNDLIAHRVQYWCSFINNHAARATAPPHVILIGSRADRVRSLVESKMTFVSNLLENISNSFHFAGLVALDCRDRASPELNRLCSLIDKSCTDLRKSADVELHCHVLYSLLLDKFNGKVACTVSDIVNNIKQVDALLPQKPQKLLQLLLTLSGRGLVLLIKRSPEAGWVILQKPALLNEVNGSIFAPENFRQHRNISRSTGVVPFSNIKKEFPNYDPNMIVGFFTHLEFCFKIDDRETLERIIKDETVRRQILEDSTVPDEGYYFFPALVGVENKWKPDEHSDMQYECGWYYKCVNQDEFLTTRFLQVLILRLAFSFALSPDPKEPRCSLEKSVPVLLRRCCVWKHGIAWLNRDHVETVVEVGLQCQWVAVLMRCHRGSEMSCVQLRSNIIREVINTKKEFCQPVRLCEYLINPSQLQQPFNPTDDLKLYSFTEINQAIAEKAKNVVDQHGHNSIPIEELLYFEPYANFGRELLEELFSANNKDVRVPEEFLMRLAHEIDTRVLLYAEAIQPQPAADFRQEMAQEPNTARQCRMVLQALHRRIDPTYQNFHTELDKFSIFGGRSPMVSSRKDTYPIHAFFAFS